MWDTRLGTGAPLSPCAGSGSHPPLESPVGASWELLPARGRERCGRKGTGAQRACPGRPRLSSAHSGNDLTGLMGCWGLHVPCSAQSSQSAGGRGPRGHRRCPYSSVLHSAGEEREREPKSAFWLSHPPPPLCLFMGMEEGEQDLSCWGFSGTPRAGATLSSFCRGAKRDSGRQSVPPRSRCMEMGRVTLGPGTPGRRWRRVLPVGVLGPRGHPGDGPRRQRSLGLTGSPAPCLLLCGLK